MQNFYKLALLVTSIICTLMMPCLSAQEVQPDQSCAVSNSTLVWQVDGGSTEVKLHLFGSIHVGKAEFYPLPELIETEFRTADYLVFEVDPGSAMSPTVIMELQTRGMLPQGQTLPDVVSAETVTKLRTVLNEVGLPAETFMAMQPWFISVVLSGLQVNALGFSPQFGIEAYLMGNKSEATDILELESISEQLQYLQQLNSESFLNYSLESFAEGSGTIEALIRAWQCADKSELEALLFAELEPDASMSLQSQQELDSMREMLFDNRNIIMADGIQDFLENGSGSYFVVVGAGHLLGENNVIDILQDRGYKIQAVKIP